MFRLRAGVWTMAATFLTALGILPTISYSATVMPTTHPVVVELFTSQGCNSCPPADALLGELAKQPDVIALAYHVDYWNDLGWRDVYSFPEAAERQRRYARQLNAYSIFTPQMMINGQTSVVGSQRENVLKALSNARTGTAAEIGIDAAVANSTTGPRLVVNIAAKPGAHGNAVHGNVILAGYLPAAATSVERGENSGRILREYNIVRIFRTLGTWDGTAGRYTFPISGLPADVSAVAILLQADDSGIMLGATSLRLDR
jgi:hypothetical protein